MGTTPRYRTPLMTEGPVFIECGWQIFLSVKAGGWATMHVVARCNNREFYFAAQEDVEIGRRASVGRIGRWFKSNFSRG